MLQYCNIALKRPSTLTEIITAKNTVSPQIISMTATKQNCVQRFSESTGNQQKLLSSRTWLLKTQSFVNFQYFSKLETINISLKTYK